MRAFTLGALYAVPNVANPTPVPVASLKGLKCTVKQAKKGFRGNQRDIVDVGDGARDWTIEIQNADFRASAFSLVAGGTTTAPGLLAAIGEQNVIAATVTVTNSANFVEDGGVLDLTASKWLTRVASAPAVGQYSGPAAGVYTHNAGDIGHIALYTYSYNATGTVGQKTSVSNSIQAQSTPFKLRAYTQWPVAGSVRLVGLDFYSVHFEEVDFDFKVEDFSAHNLKGFASQDMIGVTLKTCDFWSSELG